MRVLILGGCGAIGSNIARYFLKQGHNVHVMDNLTRYGVHNNLAEFKNLGIRFFHGDVRCPEDFQRLPGYYNVVIDCAAQPTAVDGYNNPEYDYTNNTAGVVNTLEYIRAGNAAGIIFFSTNKVYSADVINAVPRKLDGDRWVWNWNVVSNDSDTGFWFPDNYIVPLGFDPAAGYSADLTINGAEKSIYGASKASADILVREWSHAFGIPAIVNRCSCIAAGSSQWGKPEQGWVAWWMIAALLGLPIEYIGWQGAQVRDVLWTDDLCPLIHLQAEALTRAPEPYIGAVYNVGGGKDSTLSLREATQIVEEISHKKLQITYNKEERMADHCIYISDISAVSDEFGWSPQVSIEEGYRQVYHWVKDSKKLLEGMYK
jgi:CDP-paratose 2-epimerase